MNIWNMLEIALRVSLFVEMEIFVAIIAEVKILTFFEGIKQGDHRGE